MRLRHGGESITLQGEFYPHILSLIKIKVWRGMVKKSEFPPPTAALVLVLQKQIGKFAVVVTPDGVR